MLDDPGRLAAFLRAQVAGVARRYPGPELAGLDGLAGRDHRAGGDHGAAFHHGPVEDHRAHADEGAVLDGAGMDERHVPDHHAVADMGRLAAADVAVIALAGVVAMDDRAVLQVGVAPDADLVDVAAQHAAVPDRGAGADHHVADDHRGLGDEGVLGDRGADAPVRQDQSGHGGLLIAQTNGGGGSSPAVSG